MEVLAVGDVMPGREIAEVDGIFTEVADEVRGADLALGNLEGAIGAAPAPGAGIPLLLPSKSPAALAAAGFDLLGLANNHSLDAGPAGLIETKRQLRRAGIEPIESDRPLIAEVDGTAFAFLAWNDLALPSRQALLESVRAADSAADQVIVLIHWGQEYQHDPILPQRELAAELLQAGADILLGSHPHVVQDLEVRAPVSTNDGAKLISYSLGNFVFDQGWEDTAQGLALRLFFDGDGLRAAQALPLWTAPRPHWMEMEDAAALVGRIFPSERQGFACSADRCWGVTVADDARSGAFFSGAIDLTGDGVAELIRRSEGAVEILEGGRTAWRSPPDWQVVDLDLGDPNDDGRHELLLAIERTEPSGEQVSQPFVIGHRGGVYRLLWGGSPVHAPLLELELGDLDGDGAEELVVLDQSPNAGGRFVTVWRWHGWGFSQVWRSPPGDYHDLILEPAPGGKQDVAVYP